MTRVALKGLASRPIRTLLTALAIVLGVGMISAAFTLTDTQRGAADSLAQNRNRSRRAELTDELDGADFDDAMTLVWLEAGGFGVEDDLAHGRAV